MDNNRLHFLDNLRGVTILLVVALHVFLCYMKFAPPWWFVVDPRQSMFFTYSVILIDVPIMPTMFFIAGYFALASLQKHGVAKFWTNKFQRIVIPWVLGVLFLAPPAMYMILLSRGKAPGYLHFWTDQFWKVPFFSQSVFWFLGQLTLFYGLLTTAFLFSSRLRHIKQQGKDTGPLLPVMFIAVCSGLFLTINQFYPPDTWINSLYVIVFQPLRLPLYLLYFCLGILAWKRGWFTPQGYAPKLGLWLPLSVAAAVGYLHFKLQMSAHGGEFIVQTGNALFFNLFAFFTMMTGLALFRLLFDTDRRLWSSFSANSYGIYLLHTIPVYYGAYFLLGLEASPYNKAALLLATSIILCWVTTAVLQRNRIVARIL